MSVMATAASCVECTFEHAARQCTQGMLPQAKVTKKLTAYGIMTTLILRVALANCGRIELDRARQKGKGGPPNCQKTMAGFPAWEDSSNSTEPLAAPRSGAGPAPRGRVAKRCGTPVPTDRSRNCFPKQSSPYIRKVQYTVLFVLGLKGTMAQAELHFLRGRLLGGIRNKAARGELRRNLPVGFVWGEQDGEVCLHPDESVRAAIRTVFTRFAELGSVRRVWLWFRSEGLSLPLQTRYGGGVRWV